MKSDGFIVAERPLARHVGALTGGPMPEKADPVDELSAAADRLRHALSQELEVLLVGNAHTVDISKIETVTATSLNKFESKSYAHCIIGNSGAGQLVASIKMADTLILTDQTFGGSGDISGSEPDILPAAARLTLGKFAKGIGKSIAAAFECDPLPFIRHEAVLRRIIPAGDTAPFQHIHCKIAVEEGESWEFFLTLRQSETTCLVQAGRGRAATSQIPGDRRHPGASPFADIPLELHVPMAEIAMPVARLTQLKVGDLIPLPRRSKAPLKLADCAIAEGQIGTDDGVMALRLTTVNWNRRTTDHDG